MVKAISLKKLAKQAGTGGKVIVVPIKGTGIDGIKKKRAPTKYNLFVKEHMSEVKHLAPKERLVELAKMWRASK